MQIKYARAKNFLSIGTEPVEIDFSSLGNIVNVVGRNLDRGDGASNGAGKSTLVEMVVYGLYGKLIKRLSHKEAINNKTKRGLEIEVRWDDYRVVRTRKPDSLRFWKGGEEITLGGMPATQDQIEKAVGLSYQAFINVACFGQHNQYAFLSCDPATKRQIVENLLSLDKYNEFCKKAKDRRKVTEGEVALLVKEYELHHKVIESAARRIDQIDLQGAAWVAGREREVAALEAKLTAKRREMESTDAGQQAARYDAAQAELAQIGGQIATFQAGYDKLLTGSEDAARRLDEWRKKKHDLVLRGGTAYTAGDHAKLKAADLEAEITRLTSLKAGVTCPACLGPVDPKNCSGVVSHSRAVIEKLLAEAAVHDAQAAQIEAEAEAADAAIVKFQDGLKAAEDKKRLIQQKLRTLDARAAELRAVPPPAADAALIVFRGQVEALEGQVAEKRAELAAGSPFAEMAATARAERDDAQAKAAAVKDAIRSLEAKLPYIDYWVKAFGDQGIRKYVIDDCVPALNSRVNYWLQFLIDNQITLTFDNELEETIETNPPDGDPFVYNALSGGEHNRIDLAISQAFAYLMMLSSGTCPSIVVLDEVATNVDRPGVQCLFSMISELARDRQVFVITHDPDLQQLLQGADTLVVERRNGFSLLTKG